MKESKPIFKRENLEYERKEKNNYWTVVSKYHPEVRELVINKTAREILELCNGRRTLEDIELEMHKRYPQIPLNTIKKDVYSTIAQFSRLLIIEWIGENPFLYKKEEFLNNEFVMRIAHEEDILKIKTFIENSKIFKQKENHLQNYLLYKSCFVNPFEYEEIVLRLKLFNYSEDFFLLLNKEEVRGLISIKMPEIYKNTAGIINLIIVPQKFFLDFMKYAHDTLPFIAVSKLTKLKIFKIENEEKQNDLEKLLLKLGYKKEESVLYHEMGFNKHVKVLSWIYPQEFIEEIEKQRLKEIKSYD